MIFKSKANFPSPWGEGQARQPKYYEGWGEGI